MPTNLILVDFENVQLKDLGLLKDGPFQVKAFLGPNQSKIPVTLATALQSLGSKAEYVILETAGRNALDFRIAFYVGAPSIEHPAVYFHVISRDSGFDPLIKHLRGKKVFAQRSRCIADIPCFKPTTSTTTEAQIELAVADLIRRKAARTRTQKPLLSTLHGLFKKELSKLVRKRIDEHFGWGKTIGRIRQTVFRGLRRVDQQFKLTLTASNPMRLAQLPIAVPAGAAA